jgi:hypothetical protein
VDTWEVHPGKDGLYGFFTLAYRDEQTERLSIDVSAMELEDQLEALVNVGDVEVQRQLLIIYLMEPRQLFRKKMIVKCGLLSMV